jgi:hypothetical protein
LEDVGLMGLRPREGGASVTNEDVRRFHMTHNYESSSIFCTVTSFGHRVSRMTQSTSHSRQMI